MKMLRKIQAKQLQSRKAAFLIEYAVFILVIVLAAIAMQDYLKRAISGKWKASADVFGYGRQYEPEGGG